MGQTGYVVVAGWRDEDLGLVLEPPERLGVDDPAARDSEAAIGGTHQHQYCWPPLPNRSHPLDLGTHREQTPKVSAGDGHWNGEDPIHRVHVLSSGTTAHQDNQDPGQP